MRPESVSTVFASDLTRCQSRLYAYILSLVIDGERARDILQQTNVVLLEKAEQFEPDTNFVAWAFSIARYEILAARKRSQRDRLVLSDAAIEALAGEAAADMDDFDAEVAALADCMRQLPDRQRSLLQSRYLDGSSVAGLADQMNMKANTVAQHLHRIRTALLDCIRGRIGSQEVRG